MPTNTFFNLPIEKREKIINAAKSEFVEYSFHDASINKIIKSAGISRGSFYMYFENKEDLFLYILDGYREEVLAEIVKGVNGEKCDIFQMAIYIYDYVTSKDFNEEMYDFIIKTLHKVDVTLLNYFFKLDCREVKISSARKYTDLSNIVFANDEELLNILKDKDDIFIVKVNILEKNKNKDLLKYINNMKKLLNNYREYNDGIEILINKFESEFEESEELKILKKQYKSIVENSIKSNNLDEATSMITEYETMFSKDNDILNMKGIIAMHNGNFKEAELLFKEATLLEVNYNTMFNIAYLKESIGEINEATSFYKKIIYNCEDKDIMFDSQQRLKFLNR